MISPVLLCSHVLVAVACCVCARSYISAMDQKKAEQARIFDSLRKEREQEMQFTKQAHDRLRKEKEDDEKREMAKCEKKKNSSIK